MIGSWLLPGGPYISKECRSDWCLDHIYSVLDTAAERSLAKMEDVRLLIFVFRGSLPKAFHVGPGYMQVNFTGTFRYIAGGGARVVLSSMSSTFGGKAVIGSHLTVWQGNTLRLRWLATSVIYHSKAFLGASNEDIHEGMCLTFGALDAFNQVAAWKGWRFMWSSSTRCFH